MKITAVLVFAVLMQVSAAVVAQKVSLSERNVSLKKVIDLVQVQSGYDFLYVEDALKGSRPVDVQLDQVSLEEALKVIFADQPLNYEFRDKTVIITPKKKSIIDRMIDVFSAIDVQGKIVDEKGVPIPGTTIRVKGTSKAAISDKQGIFFLSKVNEDATLLISYIGYETKEVKATSLQTDGTITLKLTTNDLNEVMINKGYYMEKQRLSVGNVTKVTGEEINKQPVSDPILALVAKVPGLYISQTSGIPGASYTVQLRGRNSIANGLDPLYIVDGVPFDSQSLSILRNAAGVPSPSNDARGGGLSPFNSLNPSDIESIDVLKDADATAIYGSRGTNGVILITTKKGKAGDTKVDVNVYTGAGQVTRMLNLLNTQQYLQMRHEAFKNDAATPGPGDFDVNGVWDTTRYTNWQKVLIGNVARFTNYQASVSGGTANTQFVVGAGYSDQGTVFPGDYGDNKISGNFTLTHVSTNQRFHLQMTASYINDNNNLPQTDFTSGITLAPDAPALYNSQGSLNWQVKDGSATWTNPLASTHNQATAIADNLVSNLNLGYLLLPGLELKGSFGYANNQSNQSNIQRSSSIGPPNENNPNNRTIYIGSASSKTWNMEPQLSYHKQFGKGSLEALIGTTFLSTIQQSSSEFAQGFSSDALISDPLAASSSYLNSYTYSQYHYNAVFSRIGYNWEEKYILNVTARHDGSSRFGPSKQFGDFGAVGAGWIFSKEAFIQNSLPFLSFGKIRTSYGITGNDQLQPYQYLSTYSPIGQTYQSISGLFPTRITNPYFAWERLKKLEFSIDLGFIKDRINLSASYYRNRTSNQLVGYPLPFVTGFGGIQANLPALLQNSGLEFELNTTNIQTNDFKWNSSFNLSIPQNKLVFYPGIENGPYLNVYAVGQSLYSKYVYHTTGVDSQTGLYTFATKDGSGTPSYPGDLILSQPITQKYYGGFNNSFTYKGFQLDFTIQFVKQVGYSYKSSFFVPGFFNLNQPADVLMRWQRPGDQTTVQKFSQTISPAFFGYLNLIGQPSDGVITDASFIRLKNLSFSYNLPSQWLKKASLKQTKVYLRCQDLFTITGYKGLDPETQGLALPPLRMITAGIQFTL